MLNLLPHTGIRLIGRVTAAAGLYLVVFLVVGKDVNQYWGTLIAPLLCFGVVRSQASLDDLWHSSRGREVAPNCRSKSLDFGDSCEKSESDEVGWVMAPSGLVKRKATVCAVLTTVLHPRFL